MISDGYWRHGDCKETCKEKLKEEKFL